jgi:type II secretory pathway component PulM
MIRWLDKLDLRPQEKRLVVIAAAILFLVLNLWFVWPHFKDLGRVQAEIAQHQRTLQRYRAELAHADELQRQLTQLERQGTAVLPEERYNTLITTIQNRARECGINWRNLTPLPKSQHTQTNEFFEERTLTLDLNPTGPEELLRFLESIATNELVIRVRELELRPDTSQTRLQGYMRLVASFQKNPPAKPTAPQPAVGKRPKP